MTRRTREDVNRLLDAAWTEVPLSLKVKMINAVADILSTEQKKQISEAVEKYGPHDWLENEPFSYYIGEGENKFFSSWHFSDGMAIRNAIRAAGVKDDDLPPFDAYYGEGTNIRNLDDYYVRAVVEACQL